MNSGTRRMGRAGGRGIFRILFYLLLYCVIAQIADRPAFVGIRAIAHSFAYDMPRFISRDLLATVIRWIVLFVSAAVLAVPLGIVIGFFDRLNRLIAPDIDFFRSVPATALIVFAMAGFGDNEVSRGLPAFYISFFTVLFHVVAHTHSIERGRINHLKALGASRSFILIHCVVPEIMFVVLIAIRQSVSLSFLVLISTEIVIGSAGNRGVGRAMYDWQFYADYAPIISALVIIGFVGFLLNRLVEWLGTIAQPWCQQQL